MSFELWLFTIKKLATNMEVAKLIYDGLDPAEQKALQKEYREYMGEKDDPSSEKIVQTAGKDELGKFAPQFAHFNDDILFGENWNNPDLDLKTRSLITVIILMAQGITDSSLAYHLANAKEHGVSAKEMTAAITHAAFYAGWPKAWAAFRMAKEVYGE